jgi:leader peptidase (prepilin peptidase) / N-methyltransferase
MVAQVALAAAYGVLGLLVGAFVNVVIDRVPDKLPLRGEVDHEPVGPASWAGVPVQPWLLRRGRAGDGGRLPTRWLRVEVVTAVGFGAVGARFGDSIVVVPLLVLTAALVAVSVIDLQVLRIPDRITFPVLGASLLILGIISFAHDEPDRLRGAVTGMIVFFLMLVLPHIIYPRGMGFGDVKLALLMGLHLGWLGWYRAAPLAGPVRVVLYALMLGSVLGALFGILVAVASRRRGAFPFGPALAVGCFVMLFVAPDLRI